MTSHRVSDLIAAMAAAGMTPAEDLDPASAVTSRPVRTTCRCGKVFQPRPGNVLSGNTKSCGCLRRRRTWAQVLEAAAGIGVTVHDVPLDLSVAPTERLRATCRCGEEFSPNYAHLIDGRTTSCGCSIRRLTWDHVRAGAAAKGLRVAPGGQGFVSSAVKVELVCGCGRSFRAPARVVGRQQVSSCGCRGGRRYSPTLLAERAAAEGLEILAWPERIVASAEVGCRCRCGEEFSPLVHNIIQGRSRTCGCVRSMVQRELVGVVRNLGETVEVDDRAILGGLELDLWLPDRRLGIEFDGLRWHGQAFVARGGGDARKARLRKAALAAEAGIRLLTIFEDEWRDRRPAVEGRLRAILGRASQTVGARSCAIEEGRPPDVRTLLREGHLQGETPGKTLALRGPQGDPVAAAVFGRPNASRGRAQAEGRWELLRFVVAAGWKVPGGFSRLLRAFLKAVPQCSEIVTYSDNRWSDGEVYRACGFEETGPTAPSYWYFKVRGEGASVARRIHRYGLRKQMLLRRFGGDPNRTEWELAQEAGYDRIWDLGCRRWVYRRAT